MESPTPFDPTADDLPMDWKWQALFTPTAAHALQWRVWLAQAQQAEQTATLRYWASRVERAA